jgi:hypothetical protein
VLAVCGSALGATSTTQAGRPVIGAPRTSPRRPLPGKRFHASFSLRTTSGGAVTNAVTVFSASVAGRVLAHSDSFSNGVAATSVLVPANAGGKTLTVNLAAVVGGVKTTRTARFIVQGSALPTLAIEDATVSEGNAGTTVLNFPVTLSASSKGRVSVAYDTEDGSATAPSDYAAQSSRLLFAPGEVTKTISVIVNGDSDIEPNETLTVALSSPSGSKLLRSVATGTILNDDVASPLTAGNYKGTTQEANYLYFTVLPNRAITEFRLDSITENCNGYVRLKGSITWGTISFPIDNSGNFVAQSTWTGSDVEGDVEYTSNSWKVTGVFTSANAVTGSISLNDELNWQGTHYVCSGSINFTAALQVGG